MSTRRRSRTTVVATQRAQRALLELRRVHGGPLLLLQEHDEPLCLPADEIFLADEDVLGGEVAGCPVFLGRHLDEGHADAIEIDVQPGPPEGPSLLPGPGQHFVAHVQRLDPCTDLFHEVGAGPATRPDRP